jgi:hypothetical protein
MKHKLLIAMTAMMLFGMGATSFGATPSYADAGRPPAPTPTPDGLIWYDDE